MSKRVETYDIDDNPMAKLEEVTLVNATDKAYLIEFDGQEEWVPASMVSETNLEWPGDEGFITIPGWMADEKGFFE